MRRSKKKNKFVNRDRFGGGPQNNYSNNHATGVFVREDLAQDSSLAVRLAAFAPRGQLARSHKVHVCIYLSPHMPIHTAHTHTQNDLHLYCGNTYSETRTQLHYIHFKESTKHCARSVKKSCL